ncbi:MAG: HAMP domain-containing protein [Thermoflexales bacterium]|nr:HAMP domain-containing protein [Thermoflexales bacterium]
MPEQFDKQVAPSSRDLFSFFKSLNIRDKIVLPFLVLTLVVAIAGVYVVTNLVAGSLDERLTNQLLEAGRVVADNLARREINHLEWARIVAFTRGLDEALASHDQDRLIELAQPAAASLGLECLVVVDAQSQEALHLLKQEDGSYTSVAGSSDIALSWIVQSLLQVGDPDSSPKRALGLHPVNQHYYYFSAIPISLQDQVIGVVVIGSSIDGLLSRFKASSLADIIVYLDDGQTIATTFAPQAQTAEAPKLLADLAISPEAYQASLHHADLTVVESIRLNERDYRLARGPLRVGNNTLGVFAVALPSNFIVQAGATSRNTYSLLFAAAMGCVILVGYVISRRITRPLSLLVNTSRAVAEGDLEHRTGIDSTDEIGVLAATFDQMTERLAQRTRDLSQSLQVQEETAGRLQSVLASIGDGVMLGDLAGNFIPMNAAARVILEDMAANFQLASLHELTEDPGQAASPMSGASVVERRRFQAGKKVVNTHAAPVLTDDGECIGTVIVLQDVTAEAAAEQLKDAFIAHVSHELRTPLTAIKGFSELLYATTEQVLDERQRAFLKTIGRNTNSLMEMVNGLLDFSEMEAKGKLGLHRRLASLPSLLEDIAAEWQPRMADRDLTIQLDIAADVPHMEIDEKRLRWAIINLVRNAWQYTPAGGKVSLHLSARDGQVSLDVVDTGVGISEHDQKHLFTRFYRGAIKLEEEMRGLGLGLYVTKAIVEAHGGTIQVHSREGTGSTFRVIIPAGPAETSLPEIRM